MKAKKGCGFFSSNDTFFDDSWFSRVNAVDENNIEGVDYCEHIKMSHKVFL